MRDCSGTLPILFENVSFTEGATPILENVTLSIEAGAPTVLLGPNGCGKTTLIKLAMGLLGSSAGHIRTSRPDARSGRRAIVFQKPAMLRRSTAANVVFALKAAGRTADAGTVDHLLDRVGLGSLAARPARRLSGGEQQRLALARALARDPEVLFLDEPTASLDHGRLTCTWHSVCDAVPATDDHEEAKPPPRRWARARMAVWRPPGSRQLGLAAEACAS